MGGTHLKSRLVLHAVHVLATGQNKALGSDRVGGEVKGFTCPGLGVDYKLDEWACKSPLAD